MYIFNNLKQNKMRTQKDDLKQEVKDLEKV